VVGGGLTVRFSGNIDLSIAPDLRGSYKVQINATSDGLPKEVTAALRIKGGGKARFDPDVPAIQLFDGALTGTGAGSAGGVSLVKVLDPADTGTATIEAVREACGSK
jgi:hypothetical protein